MLAEQICLSPDIRKLMESGYEAEVREGCLLVHSVPYLNSKGEVAFGTLVSKLELAGNTTSKPTDHTVYFIGEHPHQVDGRILTSIKHSSNETVLATGIKTDHRFSNKPSAGYSDYYQKMIRYIEIIESQARAKDKSVTAKTYKGFISSADDGSVFNYFDSASVRYGTTQANKKFFGKRIGIVGLGGTGAYVLDLIAKTPVAEIHIFDGDKFFQHNGFRAPGAPTINMLKEAPLKVNYFGNIYDNMHSGIVRHEIFITEDKYEKVPELDFVFLCLDNVSARSNLVTLMYNRGIPFIDVGMGLNFTDDQQIVGACRVTFNSMDESKPMDNYLPLTGKNVDAVYKTETQICDMNALNAALAVIRWKQFLGFYHDSKSLYNSAYTVEFNQINSN